MPTPGEKTSKAKPEDADKVQPPKFRSPNYPVFPLEKAIQKTETLYKECRRHEVPVSVACKALGFKNPNTSSALQAIAALRAFGLISARGSGESRKVSVTERGEKIVGGNRDRPSLVKESALSPKVHREVWDIHFKDGQGLAPNDVITHYLLWDRPEGKFSKESAEAFVQQFQETLAYAGLDAVGNMSADGPKKTSDDDDEGSNGDQDEDVSLSQRKRKKSRRMEGAATATEQVLSFGERAFVLQFPDSMTGEEYEDFDAWWTIMRRMAKRIVVEPSDTKDDD